MQPVIDGGEAGLDDQAACGSGQRSHIFWMMPDSMSLTALSTAL